MADNQNMTLSQGIKFPVSDEMIAYAPCTWELRVSNMENRIPKTITEIICIERGAACADSSTFKVITVTNAQTLIKKDVIVTFIRVYHKLY